MSFAVLWWQYIKTGLTGILVTSKYSENSICFHLQVEKWKDTHLVNFPTSNWRWKQTQSSKCFSAINLIRCTLSKTPGHIYSKCCSILWPINDTLGKQFSPLPSVFLYLFLLTLFCCVPLPLSYMPKFNKCISGWRVINPYRSYAPYASFASTA